MEKEERSVSRIAKPAAETELFLQWGSKKRLRCMRVRGKVPEKVSPSRICRRMTSSFFTLSQNEAPPRYTRDSKMVTLEKEERYYTTRGAAVEEKGRITVDAGAGNKGEVEDNHHHLLHKKMVWPKVLIGLSSKEKEEDFMAMKGSRLPQRPKKRAKLIQRTLLLVSPGAWLADVSLERYEVSEKKRCKKRARGLKAMGHVESESE